MSLGIASCTEQFRVSMTFANRLRHQFLGTAMGLVIACTCLHSSACAESELAPELNAFVKLSSRARLYMLADVTSSSDGGVLDGEMGIHADYTLKPILRRELRHANWERDRYFWARLGYIHSDNLEGEPDAAAEDRVLLQFTARAPIAHEVWFVTRAGVDIRDLDGEHSNRYRLRLNAEKEFLTPSGAALVPYAQAEWFYDTRFDAWSRQVYQAGIEFGLNDSWRFEPYYAYEKNTEPSDANKNRVGLVLKYYFQ
jgi:hypothetical protein